MVWGAEICSRNMSQSLNFVHPEAKIAQNVVIEPFSVIYKDVEIGEGTRIGPNATIMDGARIGKNCQVFPGAVISGVPQDLKYEGEETFTEIGDNTVVREGVTINKGTNAAGKTIVGSNCLLMNCAHIAHDSVVGDHCIIGAYVGLAGEVVVDDWAIISGTSAVHQFVKIGCHAMIAGGALVRKDVPPYIKAAREPVSYFGVNAIGLRRRGFSSGKISEIQDVYRILFQRGYNNTNAINHIETEIPPSAEKDRILSFIAHSKRGLIRGYDG